MQMFPKCLESLRNDNASSDSEDDSDDDVARKSRTGSRKQSDSDKVYKKLKLPAEMFQLHMPYFQHFQHKTKLGDAEIQSAVEAAAVVFKKVIVQRRERKELREQGT